MYWPLYSLSAVTGLRARRYIAIHVSLLGHASDRAQACSMLLQAPSRHSAERHRSVRLRLPNRLMSSACYSTESTPASNYQLTLRLVGGPVIG